MSISEPFRYQNDSFQSDIFSSDIGITDVDVGCQISLILRLMSMPTYGIYEQYVHMPLFYLLERTEELTQLELQDSCSPQFRKVKNFRTPFPSIY
jgi:hypothetical protein